MRTELLDSSPLITLHVVSAVACLPNELCCEEAGLAITIISSCRPTEPSNLTIQSITENVVLLFIYPDGKETQKISIVPDIEHRPTVQGVRDRRDELIKRAIEIINEQ